jgi:hypothetical protein
MNAVCCCSTALVGLRLIIDYILLGPGPGEVVKCSNNIARMKSEQRQCDVIQLR